MTAIAYIEEHYQLRYNEWLQRVEVEVSDGYVTLSDRMQNTMLLEAMEAGAMVDRKALQLYLNSTRIVSYHPARAYLDSLSQIKIGKKDYISHFMKCVPGLSAQMRSALHLWLLGEVAGWLDMLDEMPRSGCRTTLILESFTQTEKENFLRMMLPEALFGKISLHVRCGAKGEKIGKEEWRLALHENDVSFRIPRRKITFKNQVYAQIISELERGEKWWFDREELRQINGTGVKVDMATEVALFLQTFIPVVVATDGVRSLRLTDIADCVSFRTGKPLNVSQRNRLGRWLTAESRSGRVLKRYINGSTSYLVRGNGWTL